MNSFEKITKKLCDTKDYEFYMKNRKYEDILEKVYSHEDLIKSLRYILKKKRVLFIETDHLHDFIRYNIRLKDCNYFSGIPDIVGSTKCGKFFAIEVKGIDKNLSKDQIRYKNKILKNNGIYYVVRTYSQINIVVKYICKKNL